MNKRTPIKVWFLWTILNLCLSGREATAQQVAPTLPAEEVSPADDNSPGVPMEDSDSEAMADEADSQFRADEAFQRALKHEQENKLDEAIQDCTEAISLDPENLTYLTKRTDLYFEMRYFNEALLDSGKILNADPNNLHVRILRGKIYELSGDLDKALTEFNAAIEGNPTSWEALVERQNHFERTGQHDRALADGDRIIQLRPDLPAGYLSRAQMHAVSGEFDEALKYSSAAIAQNPDNWLGYKLRGDSRAGKGDFAGAMQDFEKALELSPDNAAVLFARGYLYSETGAYDKSLTDMEKAAQLEPRNFAHKALLADFLATCPDDRVRNGEKAAKYAAEALDLAPTELGAWRACASAAAETGNFEDAIKWQERLLAANSLTAQEKPEAQERLKAYKANKPYRDNFATLHKETTKLKDAYDAINNKQFDRAIALLSELIATSPGKTEAYRARGGAYFRQKKYDAAIADFTRAIEISPKNAILYHDRASALEGARKYVKVLDDLRILEKLNPDFGSGMSNELAWFFATCPDGHLRDGGKAAEYVDRALESRPDDPMIWDTRAAVFAENGKFDDAIEWEKKYLDRADLSDDQRHSGEDRLSLYMRHKPFRDERPSSGP
jgi:tetratricopeptide (TPR) repeat protein